MYGAGKVLVTLVFAITIIYAAHRYFETPNLEELQHLNDFFAGLPATICQVTSDDSIGGTSATLYIHEGTALFDYGITNASRGETTYLLVDASGVAYQWQNNSDSGFTRQLPNTPDAFVTLIHTATCRPWWFPDADFLAHPVGVRFQQVYSQ